MCVCVCAVEVYLGMWKGRRLKHKFSFPTHKQTIVSLQNAVLKELITDSHCIH